MCPSASSPQPSGPTSSPSVSASVVIGGVGATCAQTRRSRERAVRLDREGGVARARRLADDQRAPVGGDDGAVGEEEVLGRDRRRPVGVDAHQRGRAGVRAAHEVEAEAAHVGAAVAVDDHVVEVPGAELADVGVLGDRAVGRPPQDAVVAHRDDEQRSVRQPAEARRLALDGHDLARRAPSGVDRDHAVAVEVRHPPAALVPARALEEGPAVEQGADRSLRHGPAEPTPPAPRR